MSPFDDILGLRAQKQYLQRVIDSNRVSQAYCFSGAKHLGKSLIAKRFASALLGIESAQLASHPDVLLLGRDLDEKTGDAKSSISIESIRRACSWLQLSSVSGGRKVLMVEDADLLTMSAQNAFLKSLEEPHDSVLIILIATDATRLLETILSRVTHIRCTRVPREEICQALVAQGLSKERAHMIAGAAAGRPGIAFSMVENQEERSLGILQGSLASRIGEIQRTVKGQSSDELFHQLDQLIMQAHDGLLHAAGCGHQAGSDVQLEQSTKSWARTLDRLLEARAALTQNGNPSIAFEHFSF